MTQDVACFSDFNLSPALSKALEGMGFVNPSPIQAKTIPVLLEGRDVIGLAQTGTGKTAAFALPILQNLSPKIKQTQALILAPTRELAIQVAEQFELLSAHQSGISVAVLCGGQDYRRQLKQLREGAQVVVGTPGRILDHIGRGTLPLKQLRTFILDEADEMLRMGFIEDVEAILEQLPNDKQMALFSATMPSRIRQIATRYLKEAASIEIRAETATVKSIEQRFIFVPGHQKPEALLRVLAVEDAAGVIVFVRTKSSTEEVATVLQQQGLRAMAIHGDITQALRERIIAQFKQGVIDILVATDVAARGLDVDRVTHVINYDMPHDNEVYVHRIGRTGRAGRSGIAILFVTPKEGRSLSALERHTRQRIDKVPVPEDSAIALARQNRFLNNISARFDHEHLSDYKAVIKEYVKTHEVDPIDVAAALALFLHQDSPWKKELPVVKEAVRRFEKRDEPRVYGPKRASSSHSFDEASFRIDIGRIHGVKPGNIVGAIANEAGLQSRQITGLKINDDHSTVRLPKGMPKEALRALSKAWVCGRQLNLTSI